MTISTCSPMSVRTALERLLAAFEGLRPMPLVLEAMAESLVRDAKAALAATPAPGDVGEIVRHLELFAANCEIDKMPEHTDWLKKAAAALRASSAESAARQAQADIMYHRILASEARLAEAEQWQPIETAPASIQEFAKHCEISDDRNGFIEFGGTMKDSRPFVLCLSGAFSKVYDRWFILPFVDAIARPVEGS